jgi:group I intron endonuclease
MGKISITNVPKKAGVYEFRNKVNNKVYIGSSKNIYYRLKDHLKTLHTQRHYNKHFQYSWDKYGEENFEFRVVEFCDVQEILVLEQKYIELTNACNKKYGYNIMPNALNNSGYKWTEEERIRRSKYEHEKYHKLSDESKEKIRQQLILASHSRKNFEVKRDTKIKLSRKMKFIDKDGVEYIPKLPTEFMKLHSLDRAECHKVAKGKPKPTYGKNKVKYYTIPKQHKGWKIEYV